MPSLAHTSPERLRLAFRNYIPAEEACDMRRRLIDAGEADTPPELLTDAQLWEALCPFWRLALPLPQFAQLCALMREDFRAERGMTGSA